MKAEFYKVKKYSSIWTENLLPMSFFANQLIPSAKSSFSSEKKSEDPRIIFRNGGLGESTAVNRGQCSKFSPVVIKLRRAIVLPHVGQWLVRITHRDRVGWTKIEQKAYVACASIFIGNQAFCKKEFDDPRFRTSNGPSPLVKK